MLTIAHKQNIAIGQRAGWRRRAEGYTPEELARERYRRHWARHIQRLHGITVETFAWLLHAQEFRCALCRRELRVDGLRGYAIDHDHAVNRVRGILCNRCNYRHVAWLEEVGLARVLAYLRGDYDG